MRRFLSRLFGLQSTTTTSRGRSAKPARRPLALEALENRWVPATIAIVNGDLTYTAGAGIANDLKVTLVGTDYAFTESRETITAPNLPGNGTNTVRVPDSLVKSMLINLADQADKVVIEATNDPITVKAGTEADTVTVGALVNGVLLGKIQNVITVDGEAGSDNLRINDSGSASGRIYTVTDARVTPSGGLDVNYSTLERLEVDSGASADTFNAVSTALGTLTTLAAGGGVDTFNVGGPTNTLDAIKGQLSLDGGANAPLADRVNLFDQGSAVTNTYTVRDNSVVRTGGVAVSYNQVLDVSLNAGFAADAFLVLATSATNRTTVNLGGGDDVVNLATRTGTSLDTFLSPVTILGGGGKNSIFLNDQTSSHANSYAFSGTGVTRNGAQILTYQGVDSLTLGAGNFADTAAVPFSQIGTTLSLKMGDGDDVVTVGGSLLQIQGVVSVDSQAGADTLIVDDQQSIAGVNYTITGTAVSRPGASAVPYVNTENVTVKAASQNAVINDIFRINNFLVRSTSVATTLVGSYFHTDNFNVADGSLDVIQGALLVDGQNGADSLNLTDHLDANVNSYVITSSTVTRPGAATISYNTLDATATPLNLTLYTNDLFADAVSVRSTAATSPVTLYLGGGDDVATIGGGLFQLGAIASPVTVFGEEGVDSVILNDVDPGLVQVPGNNYQITNTGVTRNGLAVLAFYYEVESLTLAAGGGNDVIEVASTSTTTMVRSGLGADMLRILNGASGVLAGSLAFDGQEGVDTLDYSLAIGVPGARVNLALGTATGLAGGVSNVENVVGTAGDDVIVGNESANVLRGGAGRDILIGRGGADVLDGGAGDDILIGDRTVHDLNALALEYVMEEWSRTDLSGTAQFQYNTRIKHLKGMPTNDPLDDPFNGTTYLTLAEVNSDGAADTLDGGAGFDWFFATGADVIAALEPGEKVN